MLRAFSTQDGIGWTDRPLALQEPLDVRLARRDLGSRLRLCMISPPIVPGLP